MKIILAIDSFKGCLTSEEVETIFSQALSSRGMTVRSLPMSDGGEGMLEAFISALHGKIIQAEVHDPLMRPILASYGIAPDGTAVIETAKACGLTLMTAEERNPLVATTYGVGELIAHALHQGCKKFIIGLGGSGTSDAGRGMLRALTDIFAPHGTIDDVLTNHTAGCQFTLASDVRNPLYGKEGAAFTFGPQKGATPEMVEEQTAKPGCLPISLPAIWEKTHHNNPVPEQQEVWGTLSCNISVQAYVREPIYYSTL